MCAPAVLRTRSSSGRRSEHWPNTSHRTMMQNMSVRVVLHGLPVQSLKCMKSRGQSSHHDSYLPSADTLQRHADDLHSLPSSNEGSSCCRPFSSDCEGEASATTGMSGASTHRLCSRIQSMRSRKLWHATSTTPPRKEPSRA